MRKVRRKIIVMTSVLLIVVSGIFTGCSKDNSNSITQEKLEADVETCANEYIEEYNKGELIVIDGNEFNFEQAFDYVTQFFEVDWVKYEQGLTQIKSTLQANNAVLSELYSNYVQAINALSNYHNLDWFAYKTATTRTFMSKQLADDIANLIKKLNADKSLLALTEDITASQLTQYNFYDVITIESTVEKIKFINDFSENFVSVPYFSKRQSERVRTFLDDYDIEVESISSLGVVGITYSDANNVANRLVLNEKSELFRQLATLIHEIGHVSELQNELITSESIANTTALLSSYHTDEFMYGDIDKVLGSKIYEQTLYENAMVHIFNYGADHSFLNNIYAGKEKLTEADILVAYEKELNSAAMGFSEGYEIFWQFYWKDVAYNDIMTKGTEYLYATLNAVYIWDLYGSEDTRQIAIDKYRLLTETTVGFDKFDDIGLIGDSNVKDAYDSIKKLVVKNYNTITELYNKFE